MKLKIAISMGDHNGIGPEVALKTMLNPVIKKNCIPILVGSIDVFEYYAKKCKFRVNIKEIDRIPSKNYDFIPVISVRKFVKPVFQPGIASKYAGRLAAESVIAAALLSLKHEVDGIVTAPLSKEAMHLAGLNFPGQTELLGALCNSNKPTMILSHNNIRVALATIHIPIRKIADILTHKLLNEKISLFHHSLLKDFGIKNPKIAVLGLNPHAGENGTLGKEENNIIVPALRSSSKKKINIKGPFPADGFFGSGSYKNYDGILAMYHDQGLIPLKMTGFNKGVNFTASLPIVRTSPDHGTAFSIAGKGTADPSSMIEAVKLAIKIIKNRNSIKLKS
jgi:4-phospho-D-threonate 3-dehydrogenase / 4-phospho-D-erythronate 3-dehydrogenase